MPDEVEETLESIHQRFLKAHQLPPPPPSPPRAFTYRKKRKSNATAEATPLSSSSSASSAQASFLQKKWKLECLQRQRIGLYAALQESHVRQQVTCLQDDWQARQRRHTLVSQRPYLRYLYHHNSTNHNNSSSSSLFLRGAGRSISAFIELEDESTTMITPTPCWGNKDQKEEEEKEEEEEEEEELDLKPVSKPLATSTSTSDLNATTTVEAAVNANATTISHQHNHPSETNTTTTTKPSSSANNNHQHSASQYSMRRLSHMLHASYRLLTGVSISVQDDGNVLVLQLDVYQKNTNMKETTSTTVTSTHTMNNNPTNCVFWDFVTTVEPAGQPQQRQEPAYSNRTEVYYLRLKSHTLPPPLASLVKKSCGRIRIGPLVRKASATTTTKKSSASHDNDDNLNKDNNGSSWLPSEFLDDFKMRCRQLHQALVAYETRHDAVKRLLALNKTHQREAALRQVVVNDDDEDDGLPFHKRARRLHPNDSDKDDHDNDQADHDGEHDSNDNSRKGKRINGDATLTSNVKVSYHHVTRVHVNDDQVQFRLHYTGAPKLLVTIPWPQLSSQPSGGVVALAYHESRLNMLRVNQIRTRLSRQLRRRLQQQHHSSPRQDDNVAHEAASMVISSDEEEAAADATSALVTSGDPYLDPIQRLACAVFVSLPIDAAIDRLVSKMRDLIQDDDHDDHTNTT